MILKIVNHEIKSHHFHYVIVEEFKELATRLLKNSESWQLG